MTDNERLEAIKARRAAITKGKWEWHELMLDEKPVYGWYTGLYAMNLSNTAGVGIVSTNDNEMISCKHTDADFIENAPQDIAYLLSVIDEQSAVLAIAGLYKTTKKGIVEYPLENGGGILFETSAPDDE